MVTNIRFFPEVSLSLIVFDMTLGNVKISVVINVYMFMFQYASEDSNFMVITGPNMVCSTLLSNIAKSITQETMLLQSLNCSHFFG